MNTIPTINWDKCPVSFVDIAFVYDFNTDEIMEDKWPHREKCSAANRNSNWWRRFFAFQRCWCPCHDPGTPESFEVLIYEDDETTPTATQELWASNPDMPTVIGDELLP